jgi:hypothetical protein
MVSIVSQSNLVRPVKFFEEMDTLIAQLLSRFFSRYIESVDANQISTSILSQRARLQDVEVKSSALSSQGIPVHVVRGLIQQIHLEFPFRSLKTKPTVAEVAGVYILGKIDPDCLLRSDMASNLAEFSELDKLCEEKKTSKSSILMNVGLYIVNNFRASIQDIHIRIELKDTEKVIAAGLTVKSMTVSTVDAEIGWKVTLRWDLWQFEILLANCATFSELMVIR